MNQIMKIPQPNELNEFIEFLFGGLEGYMYVSTKKPKHTEECNPKLKVCKCWDQAFFSYPDQVPVAINAINTFSKDNEVYMAPALFKIKDARKEHVKCTQVLWCDFDGNAPTDFDIPPSLIIQSSEPGHQHTYWKLDNPILETEEIEEYNRRLCYKYGADNSGWDANQVLRPPYTTNHKRNGIPVSILQTSDLQFNLAVFDDLAPAPERTVDYSLWEKIDLPSLNDIIYRNKFGPDFQTVFELTKDQVWDEETKEGIRSTKLSQMAYICAEAALTDREIYVILAHLADRWGKFEHHTPTSRARQLIGIIEYARIKYPHSHYSDIDQVFEYSPKTLYEADIQVDWAIKDMLIDRGILMLAGPGGIGKTQISLQFMFHLAMGEDFLHYQIPKPKKIGFFSLELGEFELKDFMNSMYPKLAEIYPQDKIDLLNKNMKIIPFGEMLPLNTSRGQDIMVQYLETYQWDGVFVDSIGSAILGSISSDETVQPFTNFNNKIRKRYGCFLWYIHHFRKPGLNEPSAGGQEKIFGSQYLTSPMRSIYTVTKGKNGMLRMANVKNTHAPEEGNYLIKRELGLTFSYQGEENEIPTPISPVETLKNQLNTDDTDNNNGNDITPGL